MNIINGGSLTCASTDFEPELSTTDTAVNRLVRCFDLSSCRKDTAVASSDYRATFVARVVNEDNYSRRLDFEAIDAQQMGNGHIGRNMNNGKKCSFPHFSFTKLPVSNLVVGNSYFPPSKAQSYHLLKMGTNQP